MSDLQWKDQGDYSREVCGEMSAVKHYLDLRGEVCPFTFVKTKLKLEEIGAGEILEVILDHEPAVEDVPRSVKSEGHEVLRVEMIGEKLWRVVIKKCLE